LKDSGAEGGGRRVWRRRRLVINCIKCIETKEKVKKKKKSERKKGEKQQWVHNERWLGRGGE
jgi:hypothetical protein